jgi:peptide chain release factor subunit 1
VSTVEEVRRLVAHRGEHLVISLYLDLDPEHFATAPARASQIRSLLDEAHREVARLDDLGHEDKVALRKDIGRIESFLSSSSEPFRGARALAVFCSGRDELFATVKLSRPAQARVAIGRTPYVEPMIAALERRRWLVALVNRRCARLLSGSPERLTERERMEGAGWRGEHDEGGWSQANYERSIEKDAMDHLRNVAETVNRRVRQERFDRVAIGGPHEVVVRFEELLAQEVRERLAPGEVDVDLSSATEEQVRAEVETLVVQDECGRERGALDRLAAGVGAGGRAVIGVGGTLEALNERRVETLLLAPGFDQPGGRCPACGLLVDAPSDGARCPADGSELTHVDHLREAVVESAVIQDAGVMVIRHHPDEEPRHGIGALLRF